MNHHIQSFILLMLICNSSCLAHKIKKGTKYNTKGPKVGKTKIKNAKSKCPKTIKSIKKGGLASQPACQAGDVDKCGPIVMNEMNSRLCNLHCDHNAIFAILYLYTTQGFFDYAKSEVLGLDNVESVVRQDALFADYYFRAYDSYILEDFDNVPPVWKFAFDMAQSKSISSQSNGLLGVISHVQRDLPLVLYDFYKADMHISEADHFAINNLFILQDDSTPIIQKLYDPLYPNATPDGLAIVVNWRAKAWADYQMLMEADRTGNVTDFDLVLRGIETSALQMAQFIASTSPASPEDNEERDAYCEANLQ